MADREEVNGEGVVAGQRIPLWNGKGLSDNGGILQLCEFAKIISMHASRGLILYYGNYTSITPWFGFCLFASCLLAFTGSERMRECILWS